jgi:uncharacterized membrane protein
MSKDKIKLKLVLLVVLIMAIIVVCAGFIGLGVGIYGARFYVFCCIASFLSFILIRTLLTAMFSAIEEFDRSKLTGASIQSAQIPS